MGPQGQGEGRRRGRWRRGEGRGKGIEHASLLVGGDGGRKQGQGSLGFRLRKGLEWNPGSSWK